MLNSTYNRTVIEAYNRGYRVVNGKVFNPNHNLVNGWVHEQHYKHGNGIYFKHFFSIKIGKRSLHCPTHRLVAYQKFGNQMFEPGIQVRHLDGNSLNNLEENIELGTQSQNMMDIPEEKRKSHSILATTYNRRFTDNEMEKIRNYYKSCHSYKKTKTTFNISSSGTLWNMLNVVYQTQVT